MNNDDDKINFDIELFVDNILYLTNPPPESPHACP